MAEKADYRELIRFELERRCRNNPRYSLRAFARDLGLAPSRVSGILNRRQGLSREKAAAIAGRLGLTPEEQVLFCDRVESEHARSGTKKELARERLEERAATLSYANITLDQFRMISDWHHLAIVEMLSLADFEPRAEWVAARLGLGLRDARAAISRLARLGLLDPAEPGWKPRRRSHATPSDVPSAAIQDFHQQILNKAKSALAEQPVAEREFGAMVMAVPSARMAEAKRELRELMMRFAARYDSSGECDEVYALGLQFYRLTARKGERKG